MRDYEETTGFVVHLPPFTFSFQTLTELRSMHYLVDWLAEWPQEVTGQLPAKLAWRELGKNNEGNIWWSILNTIIILCVLAHLPYGAPAIVMNMSMLTRRYARETHQPNTSTYAIFPHVMRWPKNRMTNRPKPLVKSWLVLQQPRQQNVSM